MRKLRIGQIAPLNVPIPPPKYGGTERIIHTLCNSLVDSGQEVYIFATNDTQIKAKVIPVIDHCLWSNDIKETTPYNAYAMSVIAKEARRLKLDILHDHVGPFSTVLYGSLDIPMVHTLHVPLTSPRVYAYKKLNCNLISISDNQRKFAPELNYIATIYNCTDTDLFAFNPAPKNYGLFLGELVERKGVREAVDIAKRMNLNLKVAGRIPLQTRSQIDDFLFFKKYIKPELNKGKIKNVGEVDSRQAAKLYGEATVSFFPINWEEPFGLVMIESMSTGTPVVAFAKGSVPEVIKDGETGFIINSSADDIRGDWIIKKTGIDGMIEAVNRIYNMPKDEYSRMRNACRKHVINNFSAERMTKGYLAAYEKVIKQNQSPSSN